MQQPAQSFDGAPVASILSDNLRGISHREVQKTLRKFFIQMVRDSTDV